MKQNFPPIGDFLKSIYESVSDQSTSSIYKLFKYEFQVNLAAKKLSISNWKKTSIFLR